MEETRSIHLVFERPRPRRAQGSPYQELCTGHILSWYECMETARTSTLSIGNVTCPECLEKLPLYVLKHVEL